jgi:hypothetical protein
MRAFEVYLNGKKLCLAGVGEDGVLSAIVSLGRGEGNLCLDVGGLLTGTHDYVTWIGQEPLAVGDKIEVKIVKSDEVDEPAKRRKQPTRTG